jgi:hypothetical protein
MGLWNKEEKKPEVTPTPEEKKEPTPDPTEALLAKMGELLSPIKSSIEATNQRIQAMEESRKPKAEPQEQVSILDNEQIWKEQNLGPIAAQNVITNARLTEREVLDEVISDGWSEFLADIKKELANTPLQVKAMSTYEAYVRNVVNMVIGQNARKGGLKRKGSTFILEDAQGQQNEDTSKLAQEDRDFLNFEIQVKDREGRVKTIRRADFLARQGVLIEKDGKLVESHDLSDPAVVAAAKKSWSAVQVIN